MADIYKNSKNFRDLVRDIKRTPLVLFVGAGVNAGLVPDWKGLLNSLLDILNDRIIAMSGEDSRLKDKLKKKLSSNEHYGCSEYSEYELATLAKTILGNQYPVYLRSIIYSKFNNRESRRRVSDRKKIKAQDNDEPRFLREVADLCGDRRIKAIVSYNYDDILQKAIKKRKKREAFNICSSIDKIDMSKDLLPIYYVHGYIPNERRVSSRDFRVVLSLDEYFNIMLEPYSWQTTTQLHFLQNYVSLFLGTSLKDWNIMRMLSTAKKYSVLNSVYCIMKNEEYTNVVDDNNRSGQYILNRIKATLLNDIGVKVIYTGDDYESVHDSIQALSKKLKE